MRQPADNSPTMPWALRSLHPRLSSHLRSRLFFQPGLPGRHTRKSEAQKGETPQLWSAAEAAEGNLDNRRDEL
jgi:hypothetical protein